MSSTRMLPPPTTMTGSGSGVSRERSTAFSTISRDSRPRLRHQGRRQIGDLGPVAEIGAAGGDDDVARRQDLAAEDQRVAGEPVADRPRTDRHVAVRLVLDHQRAAAQSDRKHIGHAEVRAHAADLDRDRGLAREAPRAASRRRWWCRRYRPTIASCTPERNAAPRIEFVGPLAKVRTGKRSANAASMSVPSFCVRKKRPVMPVRSSAARNARITVFDRSRRHAFMMAAFSRSRSPIRPISLDNVTCAPGTAAAMISPA